MLNKENIKRVIDAILKNFPAINIDIVYKKFKAFLYGKIWIKKTVSIVFNYVVIK